MGWKNGYCKVFRKVVLLGSVEVERLILKGDYYVRSVCVLYAVQRRYRGRKSIRMGRRGIM